MFTQRLKYAIFTFLFCFALGFDCDCQRVPIIQSTYLKTIPVEIKLFPNPVDDEFRIKINQEVGFVTIYNILGKEVSKFRSSADQTYSVASLKRGIYIVRIFDKKEQLIKALRMSKT